MAASRSVVARLAIDGVEGVITGFRRVGQAVEGYAKTTQSATGKIATYIDKHQRDLSRIGTNLMLMGTAGVVALGGLVKQANDWESAWAGVTKTVDGSSEQMSRLEEDLREMARTLPATHEEIAATAEAAGQLGVHVDDVAKFTRTMIDLGETTTMTGEEAAVTLQRFMNIMGTSTNHVDRLGSAIVDLGNNFASTEGEIAEMAMRIAGVGRQMGLSEADVLAMATAMSSVGIEAQAGGTAISMTMKRVDAAVRGDGQALTDWAELAGMSAQEFASLWREDAAGAMAAVVEGLGAVIASGGSATGVLEQLGVTGIRESDTMNRLAAATKNAGAEQDMLREALGLAAEAWAENDALVKEAAQRYQTREAQIQMTMNRIRDEAITLGQALMPIVDTVLTGVNNLIEAFSGLPDGMKTGLLAIGGVTSVAALAAGGLLKMVTAAANLKTSMATLGITMRTATLAMGAIGLAITAAGYILGKWMAASAEAKSRTDAYTDAIKEQGSAFGHLSRDAAAAHLAQDGLLEVAEELGVSLVDLVDASLGSADAQERVKQQMEGSTQAIRDKIQANADHIKTLQESTELTEEETALLSQLIQENASLSGELAMRSDLTKQLNDGIESEASLVADATEAARLHAEATASAADATEDSATASEKDAEAKRVQAEAVQEAKQELDELIESTQAYGNALLELSGSQIGVEKSIANLNERLAELKEGGEGNARTLDLQTESGRKNQETLDSLARASMSYIETLVEQGASTDEISDATVRAREEWIKGAEAMGSTRERAEELAEAYFAIPDVVGTDIQVTGTLTAEQRIANIKKRLSEVPGTVRSEIKALVDQGSLSEAERLLNMTARDRTMYVQVRRGGVDPRLHNLHEAYGGVVDYFGRGGFWGRGGDVKNRHIAEIAPAGSNRVWAEPETEGEAYIPFRRDTRQRSIAIWKETGRRLGVYQFERGAVVPGASSTSAPLRVSASVDAAAIEAGMMRALSRARFQLDGRDVSVTLGLDNLDVRMHAQGRR